jgi:UDP-N-acetylglucosamine--N-acetylmuramyl-(pentapeptide) pyrophosphoryl-undecaprenol N-acetylglucosamine transferase
MKKIVLCGGGSGGHVLPALALVPPLKKHFDEIIFIGGKRGMEREIISRHSIKFLGVENAKLLRKISTLNALIPYKLLKGIMEAKKHLKEIRPQVVFSKGGYAALPVSIAAALLKIPLICHESDMSPGLANRICAPLCKAVCASFAECAQKFKNGVFTGPPVRESLFKGNKENVLKYFKAKKPVLLIIGGSGGAAFLNKLAANCIDELLKEHNVIHIAGKGNLTAAAKEGYLQIEFSHNVEDILAAADYVVSRGGSNALFELMLLKKPSLIIPLPKGASRGDQLLNAAYFEKKGYAISAAQKDLTPEIFLEKISLLKKESPRITQNIQNAGISCGNGNIVDVILKHAKQSSK